MNTVAVIDPVDVTQATKVDAPALLSAMDMISRAVEGGADIEVLRELLAMKREIEADEARKAFDAAIAAVRRDERFRPAAKNRKGHNSRYADFSAYSAMLDPIIADHGISYRFESSQKDGQLEVTCIVSHACGHNIRNSLRAANDKSGGKNDIQAVGSAATYLARYTLIQAFGLAATEDDDGVAAGMGATITDAQAEQVRALIAETGADTAAFCGYLKVPSIPDIPAAEFNRAVAALNKKRGQANG